MDTRTTDRKGILTYLLITFGITYAVELALILSDFRADSVPQFFGQLVTAGVMWVPTLATLLTLKLVTHEPVRSLNLRLGPIRPYLITALVVPAAFALIYGLTWLHGLVNSQAYGIWRILFPDVNTLLGGVTGLVGIGVWLTLGLWEVWHSDVTSQRPAAATSAAD